MMNWRNEDVAPRRECVAAILRDDDPVQSQAARRLLIEARDGGVSQRLTMITLVEVFYAFRAS